MDNCRKFVIGDVVGKINDDKETGTFVIVGLKQDCYVMMNTDVESQSQHELLFTEEKEWRSLNKPNDTENEKMKILRLWNELQDVALYSRQIKNIYLSVEYTTHKVTFSSDNRQP